MLVAAAGWAAAPGAEIIVEVEPVVESATDPVAEFVVEPAAGPAAIVVEAVDCVWFRFVTDCGEGGVALT